MSDFHIPPVFDWQVEQNKKIAVHEKRQARLKYLKDNLLAIFANIIALASLAVSIYSVRLQKLALPGPTQVVTQGEAAEPDADD